MRTYQAGASALLLLDAVEVLDKAGVAYAVVGAMAAAVHGVVRAACAWRSRPILSAFW